MFQPCERRDYADKRWLRPTEKMRPLELLLGGLFCSLLFWAWVTA